MRSGVCWLVLFLPACLQFNAIPDGAFCPDTGCPPGGVDVDRPDLAGYVPPATSAPTGVALGGSVRLNVSSSEGGSPSVRVDSGSDTELTSGNAIIVRALDARSELDVQVGNSATRVVIAAQPLDHLELVPAERAFVLQDASPAFAVWRGAKPDVIARLYNADGGRLIDQDLELSGAELTGVAWDRVTLGASTTTLDAWTASTELTQSIEHVDAIDEIVPVLLDPTLTFNRANPTKLCFEGRAHGVPVAGLTWTFGGTVSFRAFFDALKVPDGGCVLFEGPFGNQLTVSAGGQTLELTINFS